MCQGSKEEPAALPKSGSLSNPPPSSVPKPCLKKSSTSPSATTTPSLPTAHAFYGALQCKSNRIRAVSIDTYGIRVPNRCLVSSRHLPCCKFEKSFTRLSTLRPSYAATLSRGVHYEFTPVIPTFFSFCLIVDSILSSKIKNARCNGDLPDTSPGQSSGWVP